MFNCVKMKTNVRDNCTKQSWVNGNRPKSTLVYLDAVLALFFPGGGKLELHFQCLPHLLALAVLVL